jgi:tungstate transport system substrate-binding protein
LAKRTWINLAIVFLVVAVLSGCGAAPAATPLPDATVAKQPTAVPPTAAPAATGTAKPTEAQPNATIKPTEAAKLTEAPAAGAQQLVLATTTSTADTGLLDYLLPDFEAKCNCKVKVIAVGTGQAIALGQKGDADVLLVHARAQEDKFVADGFGVNRLDVMYNDFIVLGPKEDPAGVKGITSTVSAFVRFAETKSFFASRGDGSGTNTKEKSIWAKVPITPTGEWYLSLGQGMGETLVTSNEKKAYTLSDRGTYLAMRDKLPNLIVVLGGNSLKENKDKNLLNPYGVIAVSQDKFPKVSAALAKQFEEWLTSVPVQEKIGQFGVDKFGQSLFTPSSAQWLQSEGQAPAASGGGLKVSGMVNKALTLSMADLKGMKAISADYKNKAGETTTYTGVSVKSLLEMAGVQAGAKSLAIVGGDGYTNEQALADVQACDQCIVAFAQDGSLGTVMPGFPGNAQVKGVVELQLK